MLDGCRTTLLPSEMGVLYNHNGWLLMGLEMVVLVVGCIGELVLVVLELK